MRYSFNVTAAAVLLASVVPASAQTPVIWGGPYVGLSIGEEWGHLPGSVSVAPSALAPGSTLGFGHGTNGSITGGGQAGYNWQFNNFVLGVEGDIKGGGPSNTTTVLPPGLPNFAPGGSFTASSSVNGSIRGRVGYALDRWLLYGTGGVAFANVNLQANFAPTTVGGASVPGVASSNSTTLVGPTFGGGLEYAINPNISVGAEYRHTDYGHETMSLGSLPSAAGGAAVSGRVGFHDDSVVMKVNYRFGAPPPPPPPMPAAEPAPPPPAAPRVFIVFFDWDKDAVTQQGMQVVQQAADAYKSGAPVQIQVTGYTDRSGSPGYNQRLSERRAHNVAQALARLGVPQNQMAVSGRGENDNRVPTANGVREPQNRRVEITAP